MIASLLSKARALGLHKTPKDVPGYVFLAMWVGAANALAFTLFVGNDRTTLVGLIAAYVAVFAFARFHGLTGLLLSLFGQLLSVLIVLSGAWLGYTTPMDATFGLLLGLAGVSVALHVFARPTGKHS